MKISCKICHKQFNQITEQHLKTHQITTKEYKKNFPDARTVSIEVFDKIRTGGGSTAAKKAIQNKTNKSIDSYNLNPKCCINCHKKLPYSKRSNKFCSSSCSAKYSNARKDYTKFRPGPPKKLKEPKIKAPFSIVYTKICKTCKIQFLSNANHLYCRSHRGQSGRYQDWFRFKFNLFDYPDLFDLELIKKLGFYSLGGKTGRYNPDGLVRDHRVSISEARKNNYDHFYITHPINCQLMSQRENNRKKHRSSITYDELVKQVDEYEKKRG